MQHLPALALVFATAALAQLPGPPQPPNRQPPQPGFPAALRLFLELNDTQIQTITNLNQDFLRSASARARRSGQVQQEIALETRKEPLDPMALGLRYAELEAIRRELNAERTGMRARLREVLNEAQRTKLASLEQIVNLLPIYFEAAQANLVRPIGGFTGAQIRGSSPNLIFSPSDATPSPEEN